MNSPTRTIFFHLSPIQQALFYVLAAVALAICCYGCLRRWKLWRQGKKATDITNWPARLRTLADQVLAHRRVRRRTYAGRMHVLIFYGLGALFVGTCIVAVEHYGALIFGDHWLYRGWFYLLTKLTLDLCGLGLLIGTALALLRRYGKRPSSLGHDPKDGAFLALLFVATLTGFLLEGAGLAADPNRAPYMAFSPIGSLFAVPLKAAAAGGNLSPVAYSIVWWVHIPLVLGVIAVLPYGRWLHLFVIPATILLQPERPMGVLETIKMEEVEATGRIGLGALTDMDRWTLMSLDGCMECGRCTDVCPAQAVGKELNPKNVVLDLRKLLSASKQGEGERGRGGEANLSKKLGQPSTINHQPSTINDPPSTDVISDSSLWACTNCHACVNECPALIRHVDLIDGIRRYRVAEGRLSGSAATTLRQLSSRENPWGLPSAQRLDWAKDLEISEAAADDGREVLLWVGCAGAFEQRAQKTTRALALLLQRAGVKFTVLGPRERCTGDPARRIGDEFLFLQLAEANIATLSGIGARRIVTQCPHCMHTLKNEYPQLGGSYEVQHHTQFLAQLVEDGRLKVPKSFSDSVTYHDPCFLARVNGESAAPRALFQAALKDELSEPKRRKCKTFCCGAGGGRMWMEEPPSQRPGINRAQELLATGAKTVAVGCPFCKVMVGDSVDQVGGDRPPPVKDVAEILLHALQA